MHAGFSLLLLFSFLSFGAEKPLSPQAQRAIKEAENLSLLKDRLPACTALIRTIKKVSPDEAKILREKLGQLAKYFYTDKGFQSYLVGKDLFDKQKFVDALDKLTEADELEKGNIDVLHYLALSQLWLKKAALADATLKRAVQVNPFDVEIVRDELAVSIALENWEEAEKTGLELNKEFGDSTPLMEHWFGLALWQNGKKDEGEKLMNQALSKDATLPQPYYWLGIKDAGAADLPEKTVEESEKMISKYTQLCISKAPRYFERDPSSCGHLAEAQKIAAAAKVPRKPQGATQKEKK